MEQDPCYILHSSVLVGSGWTLLSFGIPKHLRKEKLSGVYTQKALDKRVPLLRSFDDYFKCPHSRYTEVWEEYILKHPELRILAKSDEAGVFLVMNQNGSQIFVQ